MHLSALRRNTISLLPLGVLCFGFLFSLTECIAVYSGADPAGPFQQPEQQCSAGSVQSELYQLEHALQSNLTVIWVADPNFHLCWEPVPINALTEATILDWAANLTDVLTRTSIEPAGRDLELDGEHSPDEVAHFETYREMVESALRNASTAPNAAEQGQDEDVQPSVKLPSMLVAVYHMTMTHIPVATQAGTFNFTLPLDNLKVTTIENFWRVVEATAAAGQLANAQLEEVLPAYVRGFEGVKDAAAKKVQPKSSLHAISGIAGAVVLLPRIVPMVNEEAHQNVTSVFGLPKIWDVNMLISMLGSFQRVARITTVPTLEEYAVNPDKVKLHRMYQAYHAQDPTHRAPPIPTAFVRVPFKRVEALQLCLGTGFRPGEHLIQTMMQALFEGMQELQAEMLQSKQLQKLTTTNAHDPTMQEYILKREFAEGSIGLLSVAFPTQLLKEPHDAKPWLEHVVNPFKDDGSVMGVRTSVVTTQQHLRDAALHMIKHSCGEGWLLQPKLRDFQKAEYRVYLFGGASATGGANDTVASLTPEHLCEDASGIYVDVLLLPHHHFWSDFIEPDSNDTQATGRKEIAEGSGRRVPWPSQKLHSMLVKAAFDGARAIASSPEGPVLRTIRNVLIRVDIYMAMLDGASPGSFEPVIFINEMDWLNSAAVMINFWDKQASATMPAGNSTAELHAVLRQQQAKSVAPTFAQAILKEVVHSYLSSDEHGSLRQVVS